MWLSRSPSVQPAHGVGRTRSTGASRPTRSTLASTAIASSRTYSAPSTCIRILCAPAYYLSTLRICGVADREDLAAMTVRLGRALTAAELPVLRQHDITMWAYVVLLGLSAEPVRTQSALA